jgi:hypothetical protein
MTIKLFMKYEINSLITLMMYFLPFILMIGDIYIHIWTLIVATLILIDKKISFFFNFNKIELALFTFGILSLVLSQNIKVFYYLLIILIFRKLQIKKLNLNIYKNIFLIVILANLYFYHINTLEGVRMNIFNDNNVNAFLLVYSIIGFQGVGFLQIYSLPVLFLYLNRMSILSIIIYYIVRYYNLNKKNFAIFNLCVFIIVILINFSFIPIYGSNIFSSEYNFSFSRYFDFLDSSAGNRVRVAYNFFDSLNFEELFSGVEKQKLSVLSHIDYPNSSLISLLSLGGVFFVIFVYGITALHINPVLFVPIAIGSCFLQNAFLPAVLYALNAIISANAE